VRGHRRHIRGILGKRQRHTGSTLQGHRKHDLQEQQGRACSEEVVQRHLYYLAQWVVENSAQEMHGGDGCRGLVSRAESPY